MWAAKKRATVARGAGLLFVLMPLLASAQTTFEYNTQPRTFRVCRLARGNAGNGADTGSNGLIFEGMRRYPGKPAGWELENPLAALGTSTPLKNSAAYWLAPYVDANQDNSFGFRMQSLRDMDLIYVACPLLDLTLGTGNGIAPEWREALLQAVHDGAVLWVDQPHTGAGTSVVNFAPPGSMLSTGAPFTFTVANQTTGSYRRSVNLNYPLATMWANYVITDRLLQHPFKLDAWQDVQYLGLYPQGPNPGTSATDPTPPTQATSASPDVVNLVDPSLRPVVMVKDGSNWLPNIAVARFGAGAIVVSAGDVGYDVCNWWQGANHLNRPVQHQEADCKFAWNVLALAQSFSERGGSGTNTAANPVPAPPPLSIQWQYPGPHDPSWLSYGRVVSAPAVGRQMSVSITMGRAAGGGLGNRNPMLIWFDNNPAQDLDQDGRADDGMPDFSLGKPYDMVYYQDLQTAGAWSGADGDLTTRFSSPTVATVRRGGDDVEVVLVSQTYINPGNGAGGSVTCYRPWDGVALWTKTIAPYDNNSRVVDLSTPTVQGDFVYVAASEYSANADAGAGAEDTYGRVHCFQLSNPAGPQSWVYPSSSTNPNGDGDNTGGAPDQATPEPRRSLPPFQDPNWVAAVAPYATRPELPPFPTAKPTICQVDPPGANSGCDVQVRCASPISLVKSTTNPGEVDNDATAGGSDWVLVPTPMTAVGTGNDVLNQCYYKVWLPEATALTDAGGNALVQINGTAIVTRVDENVTAAITGLWQDPVDGKVYAYLRSGEAREYLLPTSAPLATTLHPLTLAQQGAAITIPYKVRDNNGQAWATRPSLTVVGTLPPPVAQMTVTGEEHERRVASASTRHGNSLYASDAIENNFGTLVHNDLTTPTGVPPTAPIDPIGRIRSVNEKTGVTNWAVRADMMSLDAYNLSLHARGSIAVEPSTNTAVAAVSSVLNPDASNMSMVRPAVLGLNAEPRLVVQLRGGATAAQLRAGSTVQVRTLNWNRTAVTVPSDLPAAAYEVDFGTKTVEFATDQSSWDSGTAGALWGKPVWITYTVTDPADPGDPTQDTTISDELHILPDIVRFHYAPTFIKLDHSMVRADAGSLSFSLPNGVPLTWPAGAASSATIAVASLPTGPAGWTNMWGRAILAVTDLAMPGGEVLRPGADFIVTYEYIDPVTLTVQTAHERHQVPVNFGTSVSSPALAGYNMHVGTEGYLPTGMRGANYPLWNTELPTAAATPTPAQFNGARQSLLSVVLDPITKAVRGSLSQVAIPSSALFLGTPVVSGPPALDGDGVVVGSRLMQRLSQVAAAPAGYQGENLGYVSRLRPQRTLVCDTTRLVEVQGQRLSWVCTGTTAPQYHEALEPTVLGNQELKVTPFSRPAKAMYLANGNMLVADTGNNRVVELNRQGRQVWPLDTNGYDYYTAPAANNSNLALDRPADCFRYYVEYSASGIRTSTNGNMLPLTVGNPANPATWTGTISHTVIADTGNGRVIDVVTVVNALGVQAHRVDVLTPGRVRLPQGTMKLSYTRAIPIFEPDLTPTPSTSNPVIGYLCAAANLHQLVVVEAGTRRVDPPAGAQPAYGTAGSNWRWLAWLYDSNMGDSDTSPSNPVIFRNIRDVKLNTEGDQVYLTVTCGQYAGRLSDTVTGATPHWLASQGPGVFEFAMDVSGAAGTWARYAATDVAGGAPVDADDPTWTFNNLDYTYANYTYDYATRQLTAGTRRSLTNVRYHDPLDAGGAPDRWLEMPWCPVSCERLPVDRRTVNVAGATGRAARHLVTNYAELIQNLSRDNVNDLWAPAVLSSSVFVVTSDDRDDAAPENDVHELDRREVIPDPHEPDWTDPINQPAYADRQ